MDSAKIYFLLKHHGETLNRFDMDTARIEMSIGREGFGADIEIPAQGVSRLHATIRLVDQHTLKIFDQNSTNGTYINGVRVQESSLKSGDQISFQKNQPEYTLQVNTAIATFISDGTQETSPLDFLVETQKSLYDLLQENETVTIGRQDCDIILSNLTISRQHTSVTKRKDGTYLVTDLGSKTALLSTAHKSPLHYTSQIVMSFRSGNTNLPSAARSKRLWTQVLLRMSLSPATCSSL